MTGDASAPVFFDVDSAGNIIVISSELSADLSSQYDLRVVVSDSGNPPKTATATGVVILTKNRCVAGYHLIIIYGTLPMFAKINNTNIYDMKIQ